MSDTRPILSLTPPKAIVLIVLLGWLAYANSFTKAFVLDDFMWILSNDSLPDFGRNAATFIQRPLVALSLTANWKLGGLHAVGYHLVNLTIHIAAALAFFGVVRRTLLLPRWQQAWDAEALPLAFAAAAIWVVHPLNTHAVTYVIQRCESGMTLGYILALYLMIRGSQSPRPGGWYLGAVLAAWFAVGFKEVAITLVFVAVVYDRVFLSNSWSELVRRRGLLHLGFASIFALPLGFHLRNLLTPAVESNASAGFEIPNLDPKTYFLTEHGVIVHYLRLAFWPVGLCFDYRDWPPPATIADWLPAGIFLTFLFLASAYATVRRNGFGFLGLAFFLVLAPSSSFLPLLDVANEYRMYPALMPLSAAFVIGGYLLVIRFWPGFARQPFAQAAVLTPIVAVLTVLTLQRNEDYRSLQSLWEDVLAKRPTNTKAYEDIAVGFEFEAKWQEARENHDLSLKYLPGNLFATINLAMLDYREGNTKQAIDQMTLALKVDKLDPELTATRLATMLHLEGQSDKALELLDGVKNSSKAVPRFHRAEVLRELGRTDEATAAFKEAVRMFPNAPEKFHKSARDRLRGRFGEAASLRREALFFASIAYAASEEKSLELLMTYADALAWNGRYAEALVPLREAIERAGDQSVALRASLEEKRKKYEAK